MQRNSWFGPLRHATVPSVRAVRSTSCAIGWVLLPILLVVSGSPTDAKAATPACADLRRVDQEIVQFREAQSIYTFLQEYADTFRLSHDGQMAHGLLSQIKKLRNSADGKKYAAICLDDHYGSDRLFCENYYERDKSLVEQYQFHRKRLKEFARSEIRANPEFVALGENGRPLATNYDEFSEAFSRYENFVMQHSENIAEKVNWLNDWLQRDPEIHTRCGDFDH